MFPHCNIHKYTWTSDGWTQNQIDHILLDRRRHSSVPDRLFRRAELDTDPYLVVAKVRERLAVSVQTTHRFHTESFSLKILNRWMVKNSYVTLYYVAFLDPELVKMTVGCGTCHINTKKKMCTVQMKFPVRKHIGYT
jgi:hypothetical protein